MFIIFLTVFKAAGALLAGWLAHYSADLLLSVYIKDGGPRNVLAVLCGGIAMVGMWAALGAATL
ncbi:MAG: hypothetical protein AAFR41_08250 [Pseudomonadota bacterium]